MDPIEPDPAEHRERLCPGNPPGRPQRGPFVAVCPPGKYAHCQCRRSAKYPYCDGSHRGSEFRPIKVVLEEQRTVVWCACGHSAQLPFCDGTHGSLPVADRPAGRGADAPDCEPT